MSYGMEWFLAVVAIVLLVGLLELKPVWGGTMLLVVVTLLIARGVKGGDIAPRI